MSHWCEQHPKYSAKRKPGSLCGKCWALFFLKNPEEKQEVLDTYEELATMKEDYHGRV